MKYFRFCATYQSPYTNQPYGIFIAVWHLIRDQKVTEDDASTYWEARAWFESNLPIPPFYGNGNPEKAVTWFKESAMESIVVKKLNIYEQIAAKYGTIINKVSSESPGTIIYEDDYQIATTGL